MKEPHDPTEEIFFPARKVWQRYSVSDMTLHRWVHDPRMEFPKPTYFGRQRYWRVADLTAWERARASAPRPPMPKLPTFRRASEAA